MPEDSELKYQTEREKTLRWGVAGIVIVEVSLICFRLDGAVAAGALALMAFIVRGRLPKDFSIKIRRK